MITLGLRSEPTSKRVARGAQLLDEKVPGWERRIHVGTLDIATTTHCVLGQVFGSYGRGTALLGLQSRGGSYGFSRERPGEWNELNAEWRRFLAERQSEEVMR
jgi:hypothetical protein